MPVSMKVAFHTLSSVVYLFFCIRRLRQVWRRLCKARTRGGKRRAERRSVDSASTTIRRLTQLLRRDILAGKSPHLVKLFHFQPNLSYGLTERDDLSPNLRGDGPAVAGNGSPLNLGEGECGDLRH
jgi:hypothetical protein